jgi:hypothetical protein
MRTNADAGERLSATELADLVAALDDEYMARATYAQVLADFGEVRPFVNIVEAENRHVEALVGLFERYGVAVPDDTWPGRVPRYGSLREACEAGVTAEVENAELYERLLAGTERMDILGVLRNLQAASQERHLEAFRRCVERDGSPTDGNHGRRRRRGRGQG